MVTSVYQKLSEERKRAQEAGKYPDWFTTGGYQMFKEKYEYEADGYNGQVRRISDHLAQYAPTFLDKSHPYFKRIVNNHGTNWADCFYSVFTKGDVIPSSPVLANGGTDRGSPVSCSGSYIGNSIHDFYDSLKEAAILTKEAFGTSAYLGDIQGRGTLTKKNFKASGTINILKAFQQCAKDVTQGCYDENTEILTEEGWKYFKDLEGCNVKVAQVLDDGSIEFVYASDYIKYKYKGDLVYFKDSKNIDIAVTPNHNMCYRKRKRISNKRKSNGKFLSHKKYIEDKISHNTADEINLHRDVIFNSSGKYIGHGDRILTPLERFKIAYQADGTSCKTSKVAYQFRFCKQRKIERLRNILKDLGCKYTESEEKSGITSFYVNLGLEIPKTFSWVNIKDCNLVWGEEFINEVLQWDGDLKNSYSSIIKYNTDVIQSVAVICGYKCRITKDLREEYPNKKPIYKIYLTKKSTFGVEKLKKHYLPYEGYVYCVTVPSHNLIVRSGGHTVVCGNSVRRGAWAGYLPIDHPDFDEWADWLHKNPEGQNIGWIISKEVIQKWEDGDEELTRRRAKAIWIKLITGKGYFWKVDHVNDQQPDMIKDKGLFNKASNLCTEITLFSDNDHTYSCVLSSGNCYRFDEFKDTGSMFIGTVMLDCVAQSFIERGKNIPGLEKVVRFTEKSRALGLGMLGFHSYLQKNRIAIEDFEAHLKNIEIFSHLNEESRSASEWMAKEWGEPEWCKGYGVRNTHRIAIAPNFSSATIAGQVSQGIEPFLANVFSQTTAAGEMRRINPELLNLAREKGRDGLTNTEIKSIIDRKGSVQHLSWLDDREKLIFKTAFEIDQRALLRLASTRQRHICQGQSLNLFFSADEDEEYIAEIHKEFFLDEWLLALYYIRSEAGVQASKDECIACEG